LAFRSRETAEAERLARLDRDLDERASHRGPVPDFDARFAVASAPIECEAGEPATHQVSGFQGETFRVAVLPGTMSPVGETNGE
jgi:hypothetical protein